MTLSVGDIPVPVVPVTHGDAHAGGPCLPLRSKTCGDCPVKHGFYLDYSEDLKNLTPEERLDRSKRWFCHRDTGVACRGNADNLGIEW